MASNRSKSPVARPPMGNIILRGSEAYDPYIGLPEPGEYHSRGDAWRYLMHRAAWGDHEVLSSGYVYHLQRGDVIVNEHELGRIFGWTYKAVRHWVAKLVQTGRVTIVEKEGRRLGRSEGRSKGRSEGSERERAPKLISIANYWEKSSKSSDQQAPSCADKGAHRGVAEGVAGGAYINIESRLESKNTPLPPRGGIDHRPDQIDLEDLLGRPDAPSRAPAQPEPEPDIEADISAALQAYDEVAVRRKLPRVRADVPLSAKRRKALERTLRDRGGLDTWRRAMGLLDRSAFLTGRTPGRAFRASLDFVLQASSYDKLLEGSYNTPRDLDEVRRQPDKQPDMARVVSSAPPAGQRTYAWGDPEVPSDMWGPPTPEQWREARETKLQRRAECEQKLVSVLESGRPENFLLTPDEEARRLRNTLATIEAGLAWIETRRPEGMVEP